jgi:hypothetical protein
MKAGVIDVLESLKRFSPYFWYGVLALLYLITSLVLPVSSKTLHNLHISATTYHVLLFFVIVPYLLIWLSAFYAYLNMDQYVLRLGKTQEARAFKSIAAGIRVMAWGLAIPAILSMTLKGIAGMHPGFSPTATVISNYATLLVPLIAFTLIGNGTRTLTDWIRTRPSRDGYRIFIALFLIFAVLYAYLALYVRHHQDNPFHLARGVLMLTIVAPYLYAWFQGFINCYELTLYAKKVKGLLYKQALNLLAWGIGAVIASSIFIQFLGILFVSGDNISVGSVLIIVYLFLMIEAAGFGMIAIGSKRLKRIEEI